MVNEMQSVRKKVCHKNIDLYLHIIDIYALNVRQAANDVFRFQNDSDLVMDITIIEIENERSQSNIFSIVL